MMSYEVYREAKEKFCGVLEDLVRRDFRSAEDLRLAKDAVSGLYKVSILMEMEDGGESFDGMSMARGRRDGRGRYSREGNYGGNRGGNSRGYNNTYGGSYDGNSYRSRYSRDEAKMDMAEHLDEMIRKSDDESEKAILKKAAEMLKKNTEN